ncbi:MAG: ribonuclease HII [Lachnospiraceae bacterium]|jgi:ribonuclease HII|nr:ribonuclease HII [Lachnospiraceae bacterium]
MDLRLALSTNEIKAKFQAAKLSSLPDLINEYENDSRSSVEKLILAAKKRLAAHEHECIRMEEMMKNEREFAHLGYVCGVDEVGRGPLAGPVVAGAVILANDSPILYLNDSKKLSEKKREELYDVITENAVAYGLGFVSPERIDEINILNATYEAMRAAVLALTLAPNLLLVDAVTIPELDIRQVAIIGGDGKSASIAAASIIAKVTRDRLMAEYDNVYPGYGFAAHKGYGTKFHTDAITSLGMTPIHRRSFCG